MRLLATVLAALALTGCADVDIPQRTAYVAPTGLASWPSPTRLEGLRFDFEPARIRWFTEAARKPPEAPRKPVAASGNSRRVIPPAAPSGRCGGSLPPCWVMMRESRGSLTARNPSGAAGKWQIMPGTWGGYGGYRSADQAPESVQDARARELWAGGAGCSHWSAC